jgi:hypothetical protein
MEVLLWIMVGIIVGLIIKESYYKILLNDEKKKREDVETQFREHCINNSYINDEYERKYREQNDVPTNKNSDS